MTAFAGARVKHATDAAILVAIDGDDFWIPLSVIGDDSEVYRQGHDGILVVATWWVEKGSMIPTGGGEARAFTDAGQAAPIVLTHDQRAVVDRAVAEVRDQHGQRGLNRAVPEGRCIELVCADFLAGGSSAASQDSEAVAYWKRIAGEVSAAVDHALGSGTAAECIEEWIKGGKP